MTLIFNMLLEVVKVCIHASAGSCSIMHTQKKQKTHVTLSFDLWPWNSTGF